MEGTWSWTRRSIIASFLILLAVCVGLWILLEPKCLAAVAAQPSSLLPLPFLAFVAFEMLVILQHLARILTAKLVGLRLLAFACGLLIAPSLTALTLLVTRRAPERYATEAFTWLSTCVVMGIGAGMAVGGQLVEAAGAWAAFAVAAAACVVATLLSLSLRIKRQK